MISMTPDYLLRLVLGFVVLLAGRNIFWLLVASVGFLAGIEFAGIWLVGQPMWVILAAGIAAGVIGGVLAVFFERLAFALAGFYATAYLAIMVATRIGHYAMPVGLVFVVGIFGALLAVVLMDWAIILLSSLAGAAAIVSGVTADPVVEAVSLVVLAAVGVVVQRSMFARRR